MSVRLVERIGGRDNNFNMIRMAAALCVIFSHSIQIVYGEGSFEFLEETTGYSLGWYAVAVFFCISGLLIARSYARRTSIRHWLVARGLRLFPALFVVLLLTTLVLGPLVTSLSLEAYLTSLPTWTYLPRNLSLALLQYPLPGVFESNPFGPPINGSLWSLRYEVVCYAMVLVLGILGVLAKPRAFAIALALLVPIYFAPAFVPFDPDAAITGYYSQLTRLMFPFALGMASFVYREHIVLDWKILAGLWLAVGAGSFTPLFIELLVVAICYTTLYLAYVPRGWLLNYNRLGDYSYGTYIYAFPIQQLAVYLLPGQGWQTNVLISIPFTLLMAVLSWKLVEEPALTKGGAAAKRWIARRTLRLVATAEPNAPLPAESAAPAAVGTAPAGREHALPDGPLEDRPSRIAL